MEGPSIITGPSFFPIRGRNYTVNRFGSVSGMTPLNGFARRTKFSSLGTVCRQQMTAPGAFSSITLISRQRLRSIAGAWGIALRRSSADLSSRTYGPFHPLILRLGLLLRNLKRNQCGLLNVPADRLPRYSSIGDRTTSPQLDRNELCLYVIHLAIP